MNPPELAPAATSVVRDQIETWISTTLANRAIVEPLKDTEMFTGRIKGLPSVVSMRSSESLTLSDLGIALRRYAEGCITRGEPLKEWDKPAIAVPAEIIGVVRVSRLRKLMLERGAAWGVKREKLPSQAIDRLLVDLDQLITRHATELTSAPAQKRNEETRMTNLES